MKSKIVALSKNEDFKNLLKKKKISNKYITLFFGPLADKDNKNQPNISRNMGYLGTVNDTKELLEKIFKKSSEEL